MQTFLPSASFRLSAKFLDNKRLGKQRCECWQIYCALTQENYGWKNHPAVLMWKGSEKVLLQYGICICEEWIKRGFKDTMLDRFKNEFSKFSNIKNIPPFWLGNEDFHKSHKSNLLRKNHEHYIKWWIDVPDNLPYIWPVTKDNINEVRTKRLMQEMGYE